MGQRPEVIDFAFVKQFLIQTEGISEQQASDRTYDLLRRVMMLSLVRFVCKSCHKDYGECRCSVMGWVFSGQWQYKSTVSPWLCDVKSLLRHEDDVVNRLHKRSAGRIRALAAFLKHMPA